MITVSQQPQYGGYMNSLQSIRYDIDWNLTPEHAVTMYLEWGNNDWHSEYPPVRSKDDYSTYFVVDTWDDEPTLRLVRRNSEAAEDVLTMPLPQTLRHEFHTEYGKLRGIFAPTPGIKQWLQEQMA